MLNEPLLRTTDVARLLGYSREWVERRTRTGEIPHVRLGGCVRYEREKIEEYVAKRRRGEDS